MSKNKESILKFRKDLAEALHQELKLRKKKNPRYSMRALARQIQIDPTALLRILQLKSTPSSQTLARIKGELTHLDQDSTLFTDALSPPGVRRSGPRSRKPKELQIEQIETIMELAHALLTGPNNQAWNPKYAAERLGCSPEESLRVAEKLVKTRHLIQYSGNTFKRSSDESEYITSDEKQRVRLYRDLLQRLIGGLDHYHNPDSLQFGAMFELDPSQFADFKKEMTKLRSRLYARGATLQPKNLESYLVYVGLVPVKKT